METSTKKAMSSGNEDHQRGHVKHLSVLTDATTDCAKLISATSALNLMTTVQVENLVCLVTSLLFFEMSLNGHIIIGRILTGN
eukprot:scaffold33125_cov28-Prasinocladus_malaysianus.AAC.1